MQVQSKPGATETDDPRRDCDSHLNSTFKLAENPTVFQTVLPATFETLDTQHPSITLCAKSTFCECTIFLCYPMLALSHISPHSDSRLLVAIAAPSRSDSSLLVAIAVFS